MEEKLRREKEGLRPQVEEEERVRTAMKTKKADEYKSSKTNKQPLDNKWALKNHFWRHHETYFNWQPKCFN